MGENLKWWKGSFIERIKPCRVLGRFCAFQEHRGILIIRLGGEKADCYCQRYEAWNGIAGHRSKSFPLVPLHTAELHSVDINDSTKLSQSFKQMFNGLVPPRSLSLE